MLKPYIFKFLLSGMNGVTIKNIEEKTNELIDEMGKRGYEPIIVGHGNSFKDVSVVILFKLIPVPEEIGEE